MAKRKKYRLTKQVKIYRRRNPVNDFEYDPELSDLVFIAWANVREMRDAERYYANQVYAGSTFRVVIRWPGIQIGQTDWVEIEHKGESQRLDINSVKDPDGSGLWLEMTCGTESKGSGLSTHR